ncbi:hypothetical protein MBANPS3_010575 [Mucor bainieri]
MSNTLYTINAAALPKEVLGIIFASFDSAAQLGECRRVCKKWDNPAAKAMYSKKISVKSETCALKLYRHLFKDQSKIPLIRHMHFELDGDVLSFIFEELLRLALTPTVEKITGNVKADSFFKTIFDINAEPATSLQRLKTLPVYKGSSAHMNKTIIMWTKDSIRVLRLEMPLQRSKKQNRLTYLELKSSFCRPELLEYLTYKYPKIRKIVIKGQLWSPNNGSPLNANNAGRVLDAIKDIPTKSLTFILPNNTIMKRAIQFFKDRQESASYDVELINGEDRLVAKIR